MKSSKRKYTASPTSLRIPHDLRHILRIEAARIDRPMTWLMVDIMRKWADYHKLHPENRRQKDAMREAVRKEMFEEQEKEAGK